MMNPSMKAAQSVLKSGVKIIPSKFVLYVKKATSFLLDSVSQKKEPPWPTIVRRLCTVVLVLRT